MKAVTLEKARQRVHAKCHLTELQYFGGPGLTPSDHVRVAEVLIEVFGDYSFDVVPGPTGQWGFVAWAKWITDGRVT